MKMRLLILQEYFNAQNTSKHLQIEKIFVSSNILPKNISTTVGHCAKTYLESINHNWSKTLPCFRYSDKSDISNIAKKIIIDQNYLDVSDIPAKNSIIGFLQRLSELGICEQVETDSRSEDEELVKSETVLTAKRRKKMF